MASFPDDPYDYPYHRIIFYDSNRTPKRKTIYLKKSTHYGKAGYTKAQAEDFQKRREIDYKDGKYDPWKDHVPKDNPVKLKFAIQKYLERASKELADTTLEVRRDYLNMIHRVFGNVAVSKMELDGWVNQDNVKYKTKMKRLEVANAFFEYCQNQGWRQAPALKVYAKKSEKIAAKKTDKTYIYPREFTRVKRAACLIHHRRIKNNSKTPYRHKHLIDFEQDFSNVFDFLINTALRRSDFLALSTGWFSRNLTYMDIGDSTYLPKSQMPDEAIPLTPEARQIARLWIDKHGRNARPFHKIKKDWFTRFFKDVFRLGLPHKAGRLSAHKMRDTAVMYLLFQKRYSPQTVQQITRHKHLSTLTKYTHWNPEGALEEIENSR